jgi:hypothetical protein
MEEAGKRILGPGNSNNSPMEGPACPEMKILVPNGKVHTQGGRRKTR